MVATPESIWRIVSENEAIHNETSMKVVLENYPSDWTRSCYHPVVFFTKNRMTRHKERMALVYPFNSIGRYGLRGHWFAWRKQGQAISSGMHEPFWRFFLGFLWASIANASSRGSIPSRYSLGWRYDRYCFCIWHYPTVGRYDPRPIPTRRHYMQVW